MENITLKTICGEFFGTFLQSAAFTSVLYSKKTGDTDMLLLIASIVISVTVFYYWTSVRLNPLISIVQTFTQDNPEWIRLLTDLVAQIAGGICGVYFASKVLNIELHADKAEDDYIMNNKIRTVILDAVFTFVLVMCYVVLAKDFEQGLMVGIGVALVYAASISFSRGRSGGNINFANRLGMARNFSNIFIYTIGPLIGAVLAVCAWYLYKDKFFTFFPSCVPSTTLTEVSKDVTEKREYPIIGEEGGQEYFLRERYGTL